MDGGSARSASRPPSPRSPSPPPFRITMPRGKNEPPQKVVDRFWRNFNTKHPGRVFKALPRRSGESRPPQPDSNIARGEAALDSYNRAKQECERAVDRIVKQCMRINQKYTDPHFDIEMDLKTGRRDCLDGIWRTNERMKPKGVKRVTDIFEKPQFYINNATASDVRQGNDGDCWLMAALCTLGNMKGLIDRVCVARNEQVGVYGFVFYRDGEWRHTIIDDKLYLRTPDYDDAALHREIWDDMGHSDTELKYRKTWQTGSRALYFAQCSDDNETWLPLLEKAYAKAHGDYSSIEGGFVGEAIEDLTGGVTSEIMSRDILDKDRFWKEDLLNVNKKFVFGCTTGLYGRWLYPSYYDSKERSGIHECHAYSVMDAKEINGQRLLRLRNPWGHKEWSGPWSDGSEQWTAEWINLLQHKFGNDGLFWISYEDFLQKYDHFDRTRLFGEDWTVTQKWTSLQVPWTLEYHKTKFVIEVTKEGPVVIVLSQLDDRYFKGLAGQYKFHLQFRLEKEGEEDYIIRNQRNVYMSRSVSTDITLEPGTYTVLVKVKATPNNGNPTEQVVINESAKQREKLIQLGHSYDLAHAKGIEAESKEEETERKEKELEKKATLRKKERDNAEARKRRGWIATKAFHDRETRKKRRERQAEARRIARKEAKLYERRTNGFTKRDDEGQNYDEERGNRSGTEEEEGRENVRENGSLGKRRKGTECEDGYVEGKGSEKVENHAVNGEEKTKPDAHAVNGKGGEKHVEDDIHDQEKKIGDSMESATETEKGLSGQLSDKHEGDAEPHTEMGSEKDGDNRDQETDGGSMFSSIKLADRDAERRHEDWEFREKEEHIRPRITYPDRIGSDEDSVTDTGSEFEFDTSLDMPICEKDFESDVGEENEGDDEEEDEEEKVVDSFKVVGNSVDPPWNAVCVVGLRVYSKDSGLTVRVVKPKFWAKSVEPQRDYDDPAVE
ncbi:hypothetical protein AJ79_03113 [Helicocarpus griseus UAMH5409]|uniref:Calpain catalytic domain-containing protein n=1 Tax=Helicocarpus griseus UAMH5409 TaxID=1447875 RepID=A0A2B7XZT9_9EURO|nr:hypothetical protein AJ79_03113 [Helicocarpus griseus UAMH5409]